jgi:hypothetical protein
METFNVFKKKKNSNSYTKKNQNCGWNDKYESLNIFIEIFGHPNVPQRYEYNRKLGAWVGKQRVYFKKQKMQEGRKILLKILNFNWAPGKIFTFDTAWNLRYEELRYFREIYGHCNVPCKYDQNKELGYWVKNQRQFFRKGIIEASRINCLDNLSFEWKRKETPVTLSWEDRFHELLTFIHNFGNSLVPQRSGALGKWVQKQRDLYRKRKLKHFRLERLKTVYFEWEPKNIYAKWPIRFG